MQFCLEGEGMLQLRICIKWSKCFNSFGNDYSIIFFYFVLISANNVKSVLFNNIHTKNLWKEAKLWFYCLTQQKRLSLFTFTMQRANQLIQNRPPKMKFILILVLKPNSTIEKSSQINIYFEWWGNCAQMHVSNYKAKSTIKVLVIAVSVRKTYMLEIHSHVPSPVIIFHIPKGSIYSTL